MRNTNRRAGKVLHQHNVLQKMPKHIKGCKFIVYALYNLTEQHMQYRRMSRGGSPTSTPTDARSRSRLDALVGREYNRLSFESTTRGEGEEPMATTPFRYEEDGELALPGQQRQPPAIDEEDAATSWLGIVDSLVDEHEALLNSTSDIDIPVEFSPFTSGAIVVV